MPEKSFDIKNSLTKNIIFRTTELLDIMKCSLNVDIAIKQRLSNYSLATVISHGRCVKLWISPYVVYMELYPNIVTLFMFTSLCAPIGQRHRHVVEFVVLGKRRQKIFN